MHCTKHILPCSQSTQVIAVAERGTRRDKSRFSWRKKRSILGLDSAFYATHLSPARGRALSPKGRLVVALAPAEMVQVDDLRIGGW
jgi:hypothetical protein